MADITNLSETMESYLGRPQCWNLHLFDLLNPPTASSLSVFEQAINNKPKFYISVHYAVMEEHVDPQNSDSSCACQSQEHQDYNIKLKLFLSGSQP